MGVFFGDGMRRQVRGHQLQGTFLIQLEDGLQLQQLTGLGETIAGLGFGGGGAIAQHFLSARTGGCHQFFQAGIPGDAHRVDDAATGSHDLLVGLALQAHLKLQGTVAHEDQMGVRVDQARHDHFTAGVKAWLFWIPLKHILAGAIRLHQSIANQDRPFRDQSQITKASAALGSTRQGE